MPLTLHVTGFSTEMSYTDFRGSWTLFFSFQARWQGSQQPSKYTRGLCHGGEQYFLTCRCHMSPITKISEQITVLTKSVIPKTCMLVFLLHLCMTYGLPVSGYSVSAQHLVFSGDCWRIWIHTVFPYLLSVLLQPLSCGLLVNCQILTASLRNRCTGLCFVFVAALLTYCECP